MPKNTHANGPTYDGFEDVSPEDRTQPEWTEVAEVQVDDAPEPKAEKPKAKSSTTAKPSAAKGKGSTRS